MAITLGWDLGELDVFLSKGLVNVVFFRSWVVFNRNPSLYRLLRIEKPSTVLQLPMTMTITNRIEQILMERT